MIEIRPARPGDFPPVCGKANDRTVIAFTVEWGGEPVCIAGVTLEKGQFIIFSDIREGVNAPKMTVWRTARKLAERIKSLNLPAVTAPCHTGRFLETLGLTYCASCEEGDIYRI